MSVYVILLDNYDWWSFGRLNVRKAVRSLLIITEIFLYMFPVGSYEKISCRTSPVDNYGIYWHHFSPEWWSCLQRPAQTASKEGYNISSVSRRLWHTKTNTLRSRFLHTLAMYSSYYRNTIRNVCLMDELSVAYPRMNAHTSDSFMTSGQDFCVEGDSVQGHAEDLCRDTCWVWVCIICCILVWPRFWWRRRQRWIARY